MPPLSESGDFYSGSRLFTPLTFILGLSIDQVNFLVCQLVALALGFVFRSFLAADKVGAKVRHVIELSIGMALVAFCFGSQTVHLLAHTTLGYVLMQFHGKKWMPQLVFVVAMGYLAVCHIYRMVLDYGGYTLDITGPLMISVQKITSVAYALHDGTQREEKQLTPNMRSKAIKKMPDVLSFYSYVFCFHGVMCGPLVFYHDYISFIEGTCYSIQPGSSDKAGSEVPPSPLGTMWRKLLVVLLLGAIMMAEPFVAPWETLKGASFLYEWSWGYRMLYLLCSMSMHRPMYYFAWKLGEVVNNSCGLGFSGYDEKGNSKWDLLSNVDIYNLEMSTSLKVNIESWNVITTHWLRHTVYERCPPALGTWAVFLVSAFWHGFYPGYYISFLTAALFTTAARLMRRHVRDYFLKSTQHKFFYDSVTFVFTRLANTIMVVPFVMLDVKHSVLVYMSVYWWLHILSVAVIVYYNLLQPRLRPPRRDRPDKQQ